MGSFQHWTSRIGVASVVSLIHWFVLQQCDTEQGVLTDSISGSVWPRNKTRFFILAGLQPFRFSRTQIISLPGCKKGHQFFLFNWSVMCVQWHGDISSAEDASDLFKVWQCKLSPQPNWILKGEQCNWNFFALKFIFSFTKPVFYLFLLTVLCFTSQNSCYPFRWT